MTDLIRFEWRYHTRQPSFLAIAALFLFLGVLFPATGFGPANVAVTSPWLVTETMSFVALFCVFASAIFVAHAVIRDREHRFEEIVFATPLPRTKLAISRMTGVLAASVTVMALVPLGMIAATRLASLDRARVGAIRAGAYLWPFVVMVLPTLLFVTALLFAVARIMRSALATYTAAVMVWLLYMFAAAMTNSPLMAGSKPGAGGGSAAALLDPFGLSSFFAATRYWTAAEKNTLFVPLSGMLLVNRVIWVLVALTLAAVAVTWKERPASSARRPAQLPDAGRRAPDARFVYRRIDVAPSSVRSWWSATRVETLAALRSKPFLFLLALWFGLAFVEMRSDVVGAEYGASLYPATQLLVSAIEQPLSIVGMLIVIYYGAELFWRERQVRFAPIVDATPARGLALAAAKWAAITALIASAVAAAILAGVVLQLMSGYTELQPALWLSLFDFAGLPLALYAAAAVAIHSISRGKYTGLALVLLFLIAIRVVPAAGLTHPLWQFASGPSVTYSAMYGFSAEAKTFGVLMLHWSVLAVALVAFGGMRWRRGERTARIVAAIALAASVVTGACAWWQTRDFVSLAASLDWRGQYERRYRSLASLPQPRVEHVQTQVDFEPDQHRARIDAHYTLVNATSVPIRTVVASFPRDVQVGAVGIAGATLKVDERFGTFIGDLYEPLAPGARTSLHFSIHTPIENNGAVVFSFSVFPAIGYRAASEIADPRERARRHLGNSSMPEAGDTESLDTTDSQRMTFDATLSTSAGQTAITTGHLDREWKSSGRRFFHYVAETAVRNRFAFISGRFATKRTQSNGVDVVIAYDPHHAANADAMLRTAAQTLDYCSANFAAYPHRQLKLVEAPAEWNFGGYALPDTILFSETRTFLVDAREPRQPDLLTRRVAHEVGHQWWGYQLIPATRPGATTLTESLAKYTELVMLQRLRGSEQVRQLLDMERDRYLAGRARAEEAERSLANAGEESWLYYSKGALAFEAIRTLLGEQKLNAALHELIAQKANGATTADLLHVLHAAASDGQRAKIDQWLTETGLPQ